MGLCDFDGKVLKDRFFTFSSIIFYTLFQYASNGRSKPRNNRKNQGVSLEQVQNRSEDGIRFVRMWEKHQKRSV